MSFFWNALYAGFSALQSFIILFSISRRYNQSEAGIITIGFAIANFAMYMAIYGTRSYQVTDVKEEYRFSEYFHTRVITVAASLGISVLYVAAMIFAGRYSPYKGMIIVEIVILKLIDAFEGVFVARLQQKGRLDVGARIAAIRVFFSTLAVFLLIWLKAGTPLSFLAGILISLVVDLILLPRCANVVPIRFERITPASVRKILLFALPLCAGMDMSRRSSPGSTA